MAASIVVARAPAATPKLLTRNEVAAIIRNCLRTSAGESRKLAKMYSRPLTPAQLEQQRRALAACQAEEAALAVAA